MQLFQRPSRLLLPDIAHSPDASGNTDISGVDVYTAAGAIASKKGTSFLIGSAAMAMTLALPTAGVDDGKVLRIFSSTAYQHTVTCPVGVGAIKGAGAVGNIMTFSAAYGNYFSLMAYNGFWYIVGNNNGTLSGT